MARKLWTPALARIYGLHPWHMDDLTQDELEALAADVEQLEREAANG